MAVQITRRLPQSGRIRIGQKGAKGQPVRLETFRLTSHDKLLLDVAASLYGGAVQVWKDQEGQFEVITDATELPVMVTPDPPQTWYEQWSKGGCQRRCDGATCMVPDGAGGIREEECTCDPDRRKCQLKTRANFFLPDLPALGPWRLDTGSVYVAMELPGMIEVLQQAAGQRQFPEASLAIETRTVTRPGPDGKPLTRIFPVATLRVRTTLRALLAGAERPALGAGTEVEAHERPALTAPTRSLAAPVVSQAAERVQNAVAGAETVSGYPVAGGPSLADLKARTLACLQELGVPQKAAAALPYFSRVLEQEVTSFASIPLPVWDELTAALEAGCVQKRRSFALYAELCAQDGREAANRDERLHQWGQVVGRELTSSAELIPVEWSQLADALQVKLRAADGQAPEVVVVPAVTGDYEDPFDD